VLLVGVGGVPGEGEFSSGVRTLRQAGGGPRVPLGHLHVCTFLAVPFWQRRQPHVWF
jgi:hypothetical protein